MDRVSVVFSRMFCCEVLLYNELADKINRGNHFTIGMFFAEGKLV